jgi:putative endonuclease
MPKTYSVYIVSNKARTVLYIGVTSNLERRMYEHSTGFFKNSFTAKYNCRYLIYHEDCSSAVDAIAREKQLKKWSRKKKLDLIQTLNPKLRDLSASSR